MKKRALGNTLRSVRLVNSSPNGRRNGESPASKPSQSDQPSAGRAARGLSAVQAKGLIRLVRQSIAEADRKGWVKV